MFKICKFLLIECLIISSILLVSFGSNNLTNTSDLSSFIEYEDKYSSSSPELYLEPNDNQFDNLQSSSVNKNILPFGGFIQNLGQTNDPNIQYFYSMNGIGVSFGLSTINFVVKTQKESVPVKFSISFPGSHSIAPSGREKKSHYVNYFYGDFQLTNVPTWDEIWYNDLYPGIDLRYYMSSAGLKYDFIAQPGADPSQITIKVDEPIVLSIEDQNVSFKSEKQSIPFLFQDTGLKVFQDDNKHISARFISKTTYPNTYGFCLDSFNSRQKLVIDPLMMAFSTYFGGDDWDWAWDIAVDAVGNSYITGETSSNDSFPLKNAYQNNFTDDDVLDLFVAKLNSTGNGLVFSTYLGGYGPDYGTAIAVDATGNSYITGMTESSNFPMKNAYQNTYGGGDYDAFITKLNATGNGLIFSTYMGGNGHDWSYDLAIDATRNTLITGYTTSTNFHMQNAYQDTYGGGEYDGFVTKLNAAGTGLVFSTYLGGSNADKGLGVALDDLGNTYVTGQTDSSDFPIIEAYQNTLSGNSDAFLTKLDATGSNLAFSTYFGGTDDDYGRSVEVDAIHDIYILGDTRSVDFPTLNAYQNISGGDQDCFMMHLNASDTTLMFSSYLGGADREEGNKILKNSADNVLIAGTTWSSNFPTVNAYQDTFGGESDAFTAMLNLAGSVMETVIIFSTYLGGSNYELGSGMAMDPDGNGYITGRTSSTDFPSTLDTYDNSFNGGNDAFVTKIVDSPFIVLNRAANNSVHPSGTQIHLIITDMNGISHIFYNWDNGLNFTLETPWLWIPSEETQHILRIYANDTEGNWSTATFVFSTENIETTSTDIFTTSMGFTFIFRTPFLTLEVILLTFGALSVIFWRRRRKI
ncbi:MAG: SBBP repeat-containing protein [Candidatus Hermodarchaeota archaeon]